MKVSKVFITMLMISAGQMAFASTSTKIEPKKEVIVKADGGCPLAKGSPSKIFDSTNPITTQASTVKAAEARGGADSKRR